MLNRIKIKNEAKSVVRSARPSAYLVTLLYLVILNVLRAIELYVGNDVADYITEVLPGVNVPELFAADRFSPVVVVFVSVLVWLLSTVLGGGWTIYHLGARRGYEMSYSTLFDGFSIAGKVILAGILYTVMIAFGTALLLFPGLIFAYMYRFTLYNICENPSLSVISAMRMSRLQTAHHKMDLFILDMSFLGWLLLSGLTMGILSIWISPYMEQTYIGYFIELKRSSGVTPAPNSGADDQGRTRDDTPEF